MATGETGDGRETGETRHNNSPPTKKLRLRLGWGRGGVRVGLRLRLGWGRAIMPLLVVEYDFLSHDLIECEFKFSNVVFLYPLLSYSFIIPLQLQSDY